MAVAQSSLTLPSRTVAEKPRGGIPFVALLLPMLGIVVACSILINTDDRRPWVPLMVGVVFASFLLLIKGQAWAVAPLIVVEFALPDYLLDGLGVSLRLLTTVLLTLAAAVAIARSMARRDRPFLRVALPMIVFIGVVTFANSVHSDSDFVMKYARYQLSQFLVFLIFASVIRTRRDLLHISYFALAVGCVAALGAVWQHWAPQTAWYGSGSAVFIKGWRGRSIGLAESPVHLANHLLGILLPLIGVLITGPWKWDSLRAKLILAALAIFAGLYFTYTRSALLAIAPGVAAMGFLLRGHRRTIVLGGLIGAAVILGGARELSLLGPRYSKTSANDRSAATHDALFQVGMAIARDRGLTGIGHQGFEELSVSYADIVAVDYNQLTADTELLGTQRPHNDFLTTIISWSIFSFIPFCGIFLGTLLNCRDASRNHDQLIQGFALGCAGGLIAYATNSLWHNSLDSSVMLFALAGLSVALARLPSVASARKGRRPYILRPVARVALAGGFSPSSSRLAAWPVGWR